jgi:hypothetical protein
MNTEPIPSWHYATGKEKAATFEFAAPSACADFLLLRRSFFGQVVQAIGWLRG